jgi:predicted aspartyl protease
VNQTYRGKSRYRTQVGEWPNRFPVAVSCLVGDLPNPVDALLDTGAEWSVLPPALAEAAQYEAVGEVIQYGTRHGRLSGELVRTRLTFSPDEGETVAIDATWFLPEEWTAGVVIGWRGCLERLKFGLDPSDESFYFGDLSG